MPLCQAGDGAGGRLKCFNGSAVRACEGETGGVGAWAEHGRAGPGLASSVRLLPQPCLCLPG